MGTQTRPKPRTALWVVALAVVIGGALVVRAALRRGAAEPPRADAEAEAYARRTWEALGHPEWKYQWNRSSVTVHVTGSGTAGLDACNTIRPQFSAGAPLEPPPGFAVDCRDQELALHWRIMPSAPK